MHIQTNNIHKHTQTKHEHRQPAPPSLPALHTHTYTFYPRLPDTQPAKVMCSSDPDGAITVHHHCDSVFMPPSYRRDTPVMRLPLRRSPTVRSCAVLVVAIQYPPENDWVT